MNITGKSGITVDRICEYLIFQSIDLLHPYAAVRVVFEHHLNRELPIYCIHMLQTGW